MKVHKFNYEHYLKFPELDQDKWSATACGYVRKLVSTDVADVTCKLCLKVMRQHLPSQTIGGERK